MLVWYVAEIGQNSWIPNVNREDKQALINFTILTSPVRRRRANKYFLALNKMFNLSLSFFHKSLYNIMLVPINICHAVS